MCVCVSVYAHALRTAQRNGQSDQFKMGVKSSKTVKATDFKFDVHVSRDSPDMTP